MSSNTSLIPSVAKKQEVKLPIYVFDVKIHRMVNQTIPTNVKKNLQKTKKLG